MMVVVVVVILLIFYCIFGVVNVNLNDYRSLIFFLRRFGRIHVHGLLLRVFAFTISHTTLGSTTLDE
jgi:hypothetical protein